MSVTGPKIYEEHQRDQFQTFRYDASIHEPKPFKNQEAFIQFLKIRHIEPPTPGLLFTFTTFVKVANAMAEYMKATCKHSRSV